MSNFNKVILVGNLTRDPELRYTQAGKAVARMRLAVNRRWTNDQGESQEETSFFNVTAFDKQAETVCKYLEKGAPMLVDGRMRSRSYEDAEGNRCESVEVILENFQFLPRKGH